MRLYLAMIFAVMMLLSCNPDGRNSTTDSITETKDTTLNTATNDSSDASTGSINATDPIDSDSIASASGQTNTTTLTTDSSQTTVQPSNPVPIGGDSTTQQVPQIPVDSFNSTPTKSAPKEVTQADFDKLVKTFRISPLKGNAGERIRFQVEVTGRFKWDWYYDLDGDGAWDTGKESPNAIVYEEPGVKQIRIRATSKNFEQVFTEEVEINLSKAFVDQLIARLIKAAKNSNEQEIEQQLDILKKYLYSNYVIEVPKEGRFNKSNFIDLEDIIYADLVDVDVFTKVDRFECDRETGLIKTLILK